MIIRLINICLVSLIIPGFAFAWLGEVVGITDGDSITVMHNGVAEKVRLYGIDAPELGQASGRKAKRFCSDFAYRKIVQVDPTGKD